MTYTYNEVVLRVPGLQRLDRDTRFFRIDTVDGYSLPEGGMELVMYREPFGDWGLTGWKK